VKMRPMERAVFYAAWREKKLRGLFLTAVGVSGNAATRVETFIYSKGAYAYGGYPDIDALYQEQAVERDGAKREALLHRIQALTVERVMFAPVMDVRWLTGWGHGWPSTRSTRSPCTPSQRWRTCGSRNNKGDH
jgi:peptide/nickel transport system substrate-binding protein